MTTPDGGAYGGRAYAPPHRRDGGFTLIELLVVVVILGILIAIAIPVYLNYRKSANDKAAQSDLRSTIGILTLCLADNNAHPASITAGGDACDGRPVKVSTGTTMTYFPVSSTDLSGYIISATNSGGSGKTFCFNSTKGGGVTTTTTAVTAYRATC